MPSSRSVCQQSIFSSKTRRKLPSCYQFKRFKCLSSVRSLQDGGHPSSARYPAAQRLARQDRSEGRVFCDPNLARSQKIPAICEANSSRICMSSVRSCSSPPCIYEDHETSSVASTPDRDSTDNLFGRHSAYECVRDRSPARHAYSSILIREPRFCDQPREILFSTNLAVRISRVSSEHSEYDSAPARLQSEFNQDALFNSSISTRCFSTGTISVDRQVDCFYPGCISRTFALSQFTTVETPSSLSGQELRFPDTTLNRGHRRTSMVASTSRCLERSSAPSPIPRSNNRDRRVSDGLGGCLPRRPNRGLWSQMEQKLHINCLELLAGSFAIKSFTKNRLCVHVRLRMDNTSAVVYLNRLGGTRSLVLSNLALALWEWALTPNIFLSAEHIAGNLNVSADWESRNFLDLSNWKLCPEIFRSLMQIRGPCTIDLFADRLNCQLPNFAVGNRTQWR